jgi:PAS domain S-box-containing protein
MSATVVASTRERLEQVRALIDRQLAAPEEPPANLPEALETLLETLRATAPAAPPASSEERYRLLAEHVTDVIWTLDMSGRFTYVSPSVYGLRGYTPEEVMREPVEAAVTPECLPIVLNGLGRLQAAIQSGERLEEGLAYEIAQPCRDGSIVWTEVVINVLYDDHGIPYAFLGVTRDIARRKAAEAALAQRVEELQLALAQIKQLSGLLPICSYCKKIRTDDNYWHQVESYLMAHTDVRFSHGICPECAGEVNLALDQQIDTSFLRASGAPTFRCEDKE